MLIIKIKNNADRLDTHIEASGGLLDIVSNFGLAIGHIYTSFAKQDEHAAELFRAAMIQMLVMSDSKVWEVDEGEGYSICMLKEVEKND